MLYQTQQHQHTNITPIHSTPFSISMEPVENALKGSFINQMSHQLPINDIPIASNFTADDFSVDDLLDFSKINASYGDENENENGNQSTVASVDATHKPTTQGKEEEIVADRNGVVAKKEASDICVPTDDVADLEWLSHFVEDSFTEYSLTCALPVKPTTTTDSTAVTLPAEASGKPSKARSKRARNGVLGWSFSGSETTTSSTSSSSSSTTSFASASTWLIYANQTTCNDAVFDSSSNSLSLTAYDSPYKSAMLKRKKFSKPSAGNKTAQIRRCSHCGVQKTPQWRAGPLGAKTLCNACGVRFKSGRLFPEYRPACSPTFSSKLHSNNHRKVLEMRHKKEVKLPESGRVPAVSQFLIESRKGKVETTKSNRISLVGPKIS